eukprot:1309995-Pleurochrysis_carterae.AAC.1
MVLPRQYGTSFCLGLGAQISRTPQTLCGSASLTLLSRAWALWLSEFRREHRWLASSVLAARCGRPPAPFHGTLYGGGNYYWTAVQLGLASSGGDAVIASFDAPVTRSHYSWKVRTWQRGRTRIEVLALDVLLPCLCRLPDHFSL